MDFPMSPTRPSWDMLLGQHSLLEHRTSRGWFEKRVVRLHDERYVLYRFPVRSHARRLAWLLETMKARGAALQRYVTHIDDLRSALTRGGFWVASSFAPGRPIIGAGTPQQIEALGRVLGTLHQEENHNHGMLFSLAPGFSSYARVLRQELTGALHSMTSPPPQLHECLTRHSGFLDQARTFQLTHGDLHGKNIIAQDDGIVLVDYELARFEAAGMELATALLRTFCGETEFESRPLRAALLGGYMQTCPPHLREMWEQHAPFFLIAAAARMAGNRRSRAHRLARRGQPSRMTLYQAAGYERWAYGMCELHARGIHHADRLLDLCHWEVPPGLAVPESAEA